MITTIITGIRTKRRIKAKGRLKTFGGADIALLRFQTACFLQNLKCGL
ncbi:hypothetical protein [Neisseria sp.]|nr:hypothetical protein [Neisseria sp.]MDO4227177.1 hypothetical protein [Neisseria sp.]